MSRKPTRLLLSVVSLLILLYLPAIAHAPCPSQKIEINPSLVREHQLNDIDDDILSFLNVYSWLQSNSMVSDGSFVITSNGSSNALPFHVMNIRLSPVDNTTGLLPSPAEMSRMNSSPNSWDLFFGVSDEGHVYVDQDGNFANAFIYSIGEELTEVRSKYYIHQILEDSLVISYGSWQSNFPVLISLIRLYRATRNRTFLNMAKPFVNYFVNHRDENGLWSRWYTFEKNPIYMGMVSAIPMYGLYEYYIATGDVEVYSILQEAAANFVHTTEGTTNHDINSVLGLILSQIVLGLQDYSWAEANLEYLLSLYEPDGRITYNMNPGPQFPYYMPSYWAYDAKVFMRVGEFRYQDWIYNTVFPQGYYTAKNASSGLAQKVSLLNALFMALNLGHIEWSNEWQESIQIIENLDNGIYSNTFEALDFLEFYSMVISLKQSNNYLVYFSEIGEYLQGERVQKSIEIRVAQPIDDDSLVLARVEYNESTSEFILSSLDRLTFDGIFEAASLGDMYISFFMTNSSTTSQLGALYKSTGRVLDYVPYFFLYGMAIPVSLALIGSGLYLILANRQTKKPHS